MFIYKITNKINGKIYIGQTVKPINLRWQQHIAKAKQQYGHKYLLHNAILKYGAENFIVENIFTAKTTTELCEMERYYIKQYNTFNNPQIGYNMTEGGDTGILDEIAKERKRVAMNSDVYRNRVSKQFTGYKWSPETIAKRAIKLKGQKRTPEQCEKMRQAALGRKLTTAHKRKISESLRLTLSK